MTTLLSLGADIHLSHGARHFSPDVVNLRVELLESEDLERVVRLRQEADQASCGWEAHHHNELNERESERLMVAARQSCWWEETSTSRRRYGRLEGGNNET